MGLQKTKRSKHGHSSNYWNISVNNQSRMAEKVGVVTLCLYKDRAAYIAGDDITESYGMICEGDDWDDNLAPRVLEAVGVNPRKKLYPWVKANATAQIGFNLSDAVDIDPD